MVIVGGGGFAEELVSWHSPSQATALAGYVASSPNPAIKLKYLGTFEQISSLQLEIFLVAVGSPEVRLKAIEIIKQAGKSFGSFIHSTATVVESASLGPGVLVGPYCMVSAGASLDELVFMNCYSSVGHHAKIGKRVILNPYAAITGNCVIGDDCVFGLSSSILPKSKLPNGTRVAPGSSVYRSVRERCTLIGVPARPVKGV